MHEGPAMPAVEAGVEPSLAAELELAAVPHEELVRRLYRLCLRREPEPDALHGDYGWFVQDEPDRWRARFHAAGFLVFEDELYELTAEGWRAAESVTAGMRYGERGPARRLSSVPSCTQRHRQTFCSMRSDGGARPPRSRT